MGSLCRRHDLLLRRIGRAIGDILPHGSGLQPGILQHHAVAAPQGLSGHRADILSRCPDHAPIHIVKAHQQIDECGLTATGRAYDGHPLTGCNLQIQIPDQGFFGHIGEFHMLQLHLTHLGSVRQFRFLRGLLLLIQQVEHPLGAGNRVLQLCHHAADLIEGLCILAGVTQKYAELTDGNAAGAYKQRTYQSHCRIDNVVDKSCAGVGKAGEEGSMQRRLGKAVVAFRKLLQTLFLMTVGFHHPLTLYQFIDEGCLDAPLLGLLLEMLMGAPRNKAGYQEGHGRQQHHNGGDPGI